MSNSTNEPGLVSTTSENDVETTSNTNANKPTMNTTTSKNNSSKNNNSKNNTRKNANANKKNNNNYSNSMKSLYGDDENAFENTKKNGVNANVNANKKDNDNYSNSMKSLYGEEDAFENTSNAKESEEEPTSSLNSKIAAIQPLLDQVAELKASYKNTPNDKRNAIKEEFETTKQNLVTLQTEINQLIADMTLETNAISFLKQKYPNYISSLESLKVLGKKNSTEQVGEEMGAGMSNNNAMNINNNANASTITKNTNRNSNVSSNSNRNSNTSSNTGTNNRSNNGSNTGNNNRSNTGSKNNSASNNGSKNNSANNNTNKKNTTPGMNDPLPNLPSNSRQHNQSGGKNRKNKSRKVNKRR